MKRVKRGRPPLHGKPGTRFQVHLTLDCVKALKRLGGGSLSQGIHQAALRAGLLKV